jgi:hypothetical protein
MKIVALVLDELFGSVRSGLADKELDNFTLGVKRP